MHYYYANPTNSYECSKLKLYGTEQEQRHKHHRLIVLQSSMLEQTSGNTPLRVVEGWNRLPDQVKTTASRMHSNECSNKNNHYVRSKMMDQREVKKQSSYLHDSRTVINYSG